MEIDDLEERISKLLKETKKVVKTINEFDMENGSIEELAQYEIVLNCLKQKVEDLIEEVEIEEVLESVNQSLIDEGYIKYENE